MLARLQHPNILPLHDSGYVEALLYYLMPYVSGETDLPMRTICPASGDSFQLPRFFPRRSQPQLAQWSWRLTSPIGECERALERDRTSFLALLAMTLSYAAKGMYKEAISHAERGVSLSSDFNLLRALLAAVYAMAGETSAAERVTAELLERSKQVYVGPTTISWIYANLDEPDAAFDWLGNACSARDCTLGFEIRVPLYDRISGDPRFQELLAYLGLD